MAEMYLCLDEVSLSRVLDYREKNEVTVDVGRVFLFARNTNKEEARKYIMGYCDKYVTKIVRRTVAFIIYEEWLPELYEEMEHADAQVLKRYRKMERNCVHMPTELYKEMKKELNEEIKQHIDIHNVLVKSIKIAEKSEDTAFYDNTWLVEWLKATRPLYDAFVEFKAKIDHFH